MIMKNFLQIFGAIIFCELIGFLPIPFTFRAIPTWYAHLHKPFFSPPNIIFGPIWTILYLLMGVALFLVLRKKKNKKTLFFFLLQLLFNFLWSVVFFGLHAPILGVVDIVLLLGTILITMWYLRVLSKPAFLLFIPYVLWVSFATVLNIAIVVLN